MLLFKDKLEGEISTLLLDFLSVQVVWYIVYDLISTHNKK